MAGVVAPLRRTIRPFKDDRTYAYSGGLRYVRHPQFAKDALHYIRSFNLLQNQLRELFEYIEPDDNNLKTYSFRTLSLLIRTCVEVEANFKAVLIENGYSSTSNWTLADYSKVERSHRLSEYRVRIPFWKGRAIERSPFKNWGQPNGRLAWYQAYNSAKHDRHNSFSEATFENLTDAVSGLFVLLSAQFHTEDFAARDVLLAESSNTSHPDFEIGLGGMFEVSFPCGWTDAECYEFDRASVDFSNPDFVKKTDYSKVPSV